MSDLGLLATNKSKRDNTMKCYPVKNASTNQLKEFRKAIDEELERRKEKEWEELHKAYDTIINSVRNNPSGCFDNMGATRYLKDMATVKIDPSRRRGKTSYIVKKFAPNRDMIIVHNLPAKEEMIKRCLERFPTMSPEELPVYTISDIICPVHMAYASSKYVIQRALDDIVWIDESKLITDRNLDILYSILATSPSAGKLTVVCMG